FSCAKADDGDLKISGDLATSIFWESGKGLNGGVGVGAPTAGGADSSHANFTVDELILDASKTIGNSTFQLGLGYGKLFETANGLTDAATGLTRNTINITNAYFQHKVGDTGLSFKLGRFVTY